MLFRTSLRRTPLRQTLWSVPRGVRLQRFYCISIAAAYDLMPLSDRNQGIGHRIAKNGFQCNKQSTATVLFASIFPSLILKYCAPFCSPISILATVKSSPLLSNFQDFPIPLLFGPPCLLGTVEYL